MSAIFQDDALPFAAVTETLHGIEVEDPFRWLEDQDAPATRIFLTGEAMRYRKYLNSHAGLRSRIRRRVAELLTVETMDLPTPDRHGGLIYLKRGAEEQQKILQHRDRDGRESLLLSPEMFAGDASLAALQMSPGGRYLVLGVRSGGEDIQEVYFYDLLHRQLLPDRLGRGFYRGIVFDPSETCIYYSHEDAAGEYQLRRAVRQHRLGAESSQDREVFYAGEGPALRLIVQGAADGRWLGYRTVSLESIPETQFLVHAAPFDGPARKIASLKGVAFGPTLVKDTVEAVTTLEAPNGQVVRFSITQSEGPSRWETVLPEAPEKLHAYMRIGDLRVAHYLAESEKLTRIYKPGGRLLRTIEYPRSGTTVLGQIDAATGRLYYAYSDADSPPSIRTVELDSGEHRTWWQQGSPAAFPELKVERRQYPSNDGTLVPITITASRMQRRPSPVLLSAYGAGGASNTPKFSVLLTVLAEEGFLCATAHVRGGGEQGVQWHQAGSRSRKQNSVDDLICAAEWLQNEGYAEKSRLGVGGQSNGALLALCALTQRPDLFRAVLALGPIVDLTRFHLFGVARSFVTELGSPEDPDEFPALYQLSPYHQVHNDRQYPAVLIVSGDRDHRCDALHARKMVAKLQAVQPRRHPILLDYSPIRGHKPVLPLKERIDGLTDRLTFLIAELGEQKEYGQ
jgi:prolyl oligopeptidase